MNVHPLRLAAWTATPVLLTVLLSCHPATAHASLLLSPISALLLLGLGLRFWEADPEDIPTILFRACLPFYLALGALLSQALIGLILLGFWVRGELRMDPWLLGGDGRDLLELQGWLFACITPLLTLSHLLMPLLLGPQQRARALAARLTRAQEAPRYLRQILAHLEGLALKRPDEAAQAIEQVAPLVRQLAALPEGRRVLAEEALRWAELPLNLERRITGHGLELQVEIQEDAPLVPALVFAALVEDVRRHPQDPEPAHLRVGLEPTGTGTWCAFATFGAQHRRLPLAEA